MDTTTPVSQSTAVPAEPFVGHRLSEGVRVTVLTLGWLACVNGVFGNVLIILTLLSQQALRSVHNIYIANLALADLLVVGYAVVFWLLDLSLGYHPVVSHAHCSVNSFILVVCFTSSVYTLVFISFNRYLSVCHSAVYPRVFSKRSTVGSCIVLWLLASVQACLPIYNIGNAAYIYNIRSHLCSFDTKDATNIASVLSVINLVIPTILVGSFSLSILRFWKRSKTRIGQWSQSQRQAARVKARISSSDIALVRSLILVFVLLVVMYIPLAVSLAIYRSVYVSPDLYAVMLLFFFLNNSINWIVYGLMNKNFRNGYRRIFSRCYNKGLHQPENEGTIHTLATVQ